MTAESSSTKLSEPKASNAGLWAATALASETPHSTAIQANVTACNHTMRCLNSAGDKALLFAQPRLRKPDLDDLGHGSENSVLIILAWRSVRACA